MLVKIREYCSADPVAFSNKKYCIEYSLYVTDSLKVCSIEYCLPNSF